MHTNNVKANHRPGLTKEYWDSNELPPRGDFEFITEPNGQRRFWFICPGCMTMAPLAIRPVIDGSPQSWEWDGNTEAPTLTPSINHNGCWHGWLTAGQFTSC